jgi:hypothetical protein
VPPFWKPLATVSRSVQNSSVRNLPTLASAEKVRKLSARCPCNLAATIQSVEVEMQLLFSDVTRMNPESSVSIDEKHMSDSAHRSPDRMTIVAALETRDCDADHSRFAVVPVC